MKSPHRLICLLLVMGLFFSLSASPTSNRDLRKGEIIYRIYNDFVTLSYDGGKSWQFHKEMDSRVEAFELPGPATISVESDKWLYAVSGGGRSISIYTKPASTK